MTWCNMWWCHCHSWVEPGLRFLLVQMYPTSNPLWPVDVITQWCHHLMSWWCHLPMMSILDDVIMTSSPSDVTTWWCHCHYLYALQQFLHTPEAVSLNHPDSFLRKLADLKRLWILVTSCKGKRLSVIVSKLARQHLLHGTQNSLHPQTTF